MELKIYSLPILTPANLRKIRNVRSNFKSFDKLINCSGCGVMISVFTSVRVGGHHYCKGCVKRNRAFERL